MEKSERELELEATLVLIRNKKKKLILDGVTQYGADGTQATNITLESLRREEDRVAWELFAERNQRITDDDGPNQFLTQYQFSRHPQF